MLPPQSGSSNSNVAALQYGVEGFRDHPCPSPLPQAEASSSNRDVGAAVPAPQRPMLSAAQMPRMGWRTRRESRLPCCRSQKLEPRPGSSRALCHPRTSQTQASPSPRCAEEVRPPGAGARSRGEPCSAEMPRLGVRLSMLVKPHKPLPNPRTGRRRQDVLSVAECHRLCGSASRVFSTSQRKMLSGGVAAVPREQHLPGIPPVQLG